MFKTTLTALRLFNSFKAVPVDRSSNRNRNEKKKIKKKEDTCPFFFFFLNDYFCCLGATRPTAPRVW